MCTEWFLQSFFWNSNVIITKSALMRVSNEAEWWITRPSAFLNTKFETRRIFVRRLSSVYLVLRYSQDLIAKNSAKMRSCVNTNSHGDIDSSCIFLKTDARRGELSAFSGFCLYSCILSTVLGGGSKSYRLHPIGGLACCLPWRPEPHMRRWLRLSIGPEIPDFGYWRLLLKLLGRRWTWGCSVGTWIILRDKVSIAFRWQ